MIFSSVKSWSENIDIAKGFAVMEQTSIRAFKTNEEILVLYELEGGVNGYIPSEYCYKDMALTSYVALTFKATLKDI